MDIMECVVEMNTTAQMSNESTEDYYNIFEAHRNTVNAHKVCAGYHPGMYKKALANMMLKKGKATQDLAEDLSLKTKIREAPATKSTEEFLACLFILLANNSRCKGLKEDLANAYTMG